MGHEAHDGEDDKSCEHAGARVDTADDDGVPAERGGWQAGELGTRARGEGQGAKGRGQEGVPGSRAAGQVPHPTPGRDWNPEGVATGSGLDRNGVESGERPQGRAYRGCGQKGRDSWALSPVDIVVERVIAPKSDQGSQAQSIGEEDLGCCIQPHLEEE